MSAAQNKSRRNFLKACAFVPLALAANRILGASSFPWQNKAFINKTSATSEPVQSMTYVQLYQSGELKTRIKELYSNLKSCTLCPRRCKVNRLSGETGICKAGKILKVGYYGSSYEEEKELINTQGSGAIRLSHCNLLCDFCITAHESHEGGGKFMGTKGLSDIVLYFQKLGTANINFYTPSHFAPHVLQSLYLSIPKGLNLPIVYNTSVYEEVSLLKYLSGIISVYIADLKFFSSTIAKRYANGATNYPDAALKAVSEMQNQVGTARVESDGIIRKGLIVRHLILPGNSNDSKNLMTWVAQNLPKDTYINLIPNFHPYYKAAKYPEINRNITKKEYFDVVNECEKQGLTRVIYQKNYFNS